MARVGYSRVESDSANSNRGLLLETTRSGSPQTSPRRMEEVSSDDFNSKDPKVPYNQRLGHVRKVIENTQDDRAKVFNVGLGPVSLEMEQRRGPKDKSCWSRFRRGDFVIVPLPSATGRLNRMIEVWDLFLVFLLAITAYYVPWEAALYSSKEVGECVNVNHFLDISFTVDIVLQFFIAVQNKDSSVDQWMKDPVMIARRYCAWPLSDRGEAGWLWIDLLSVGPGYWSITTGCILRTPTDSVVDMMRVLRLTRMLRLFRLFTLVDRWHAFFGFSYYALEIMKFLAITSLSCHWFACVWVMAEGTVSNGAVSYHTDGPTWLSAVIAAKGDPCTPNAGEDPMCTYVLAAYWASMTLTTVGYGDIVPQNLFEYGLCTCMMLMSGFIWAYIVGNVMYVLLTMDPYGIQFKQDMDNLNNMMATRDLPHALRYRMRLYMHGNRSHVEYKGQQEVLEQNMSEGLQRESAAHSLEHLLDGIYWMNGLDNNSKLEVIKAMRPCFYGPRESIMVTSTMLIVRRGLLASKGRILRRGDAWGHENVLLESGHLMDEHPPFTLSYLTALQLTREDLNAICLKSPQADMRLRRAQVRTAAWRSFRHAAIKKKTVEAFSGERKESKERSLTYGSESSNIGQASPKKGVLLHAGSFVNNTGKRHAPSLEDQGLEDLKELTKESSIPEPTPPTFTHHADGDSNAIIAHLQRIEQAVARSKSEVTDQQRELSVKVEILSSQVAQLTAKLNLMSP